MQEQIAMNTKLMGLIQAQTHDPMWLFDAETILGLSSNDAYHGDWDFEHWNKSWGEIERVTQGPKVIIVWHRPDGAEPLADVSALPMNIRVLRFALMGRLAKGLLEIGQLSYVRVGFPECWAKCKIYCNGKEMQLIVTADALLGVIKQHHRDPQGKLVLSPDGNSFDHQRVAGHVEIKVDEVQQPFF